MNGPVLLTFHPEKTANSIEKGRNLLLALLPWNRICENVEILQFNKLPFLAIPIGYML